MLAGSKQEREPHATCRAQLSTRKKNLPRIARSDCNGVIRVGSLKAFCFAFKEILHSKKFWEKKVQEGGLLKREVSLFLLRPRERGWRRVGHHSSLPQVVSSHSKFEISKAFHQRPDEFQREMDKRPKDTTVDPVVEIIGPNQSKSEEKENKARNVPLQSLHAPNVNQESQRT